MQLTAHGKMLPITKIVRIMKLSVILLLIFLQVAARPREIFAQVTLKETSASLESVLKSIKKQSDYGITFDEILIRTKGKPVTVTVNNVSVEEALLQVFKNQDKLSYSFNGKIISIKEKSRVSSPIVFEQPLPPPSVKGKVVNEKGEPLAGVSVQVKGTRRGVATNDSGEFELKDVNDDAVLQFSGVNIVTYEIKLDGRSELIVTAKAKVMELQDIAITANTGFQQVKPNETTGSLVVITKEQLDQRVAPDLISKLEGITNGLAFNRDRTGATSLRVRGESTILANPSPLIVVDNFPFDGDINSINPNDVESVTLLKDAAAASIWGVQAGNGVIVITTKKGKINQPMRVQLTSNLTISSKPDLYYQSRISSSDYIDAETLLFKGGFYTSALNDINKMSVSPVIELLNRRQLGQISAADSANGINAFRNYDYRNQLSDYAYGSARLQQYQVNVSGGSVRNAYYFSLGYDRNQAELKGNSSERYSLNAQNTYTPSRNVEIKMGLMYSQNNGINNGLPTIPNIYPYTRIADDQGYRLSVPQRRQFFEDTIVNRGFQDWKYNPLNERDAINNVSKSTSALLNIGFTYSPLKWISISGLYQYNSVKNMESRLTMKNSYTLRNLFNTYAIVTNGNYTGTNYPEGATLGLTNGEVLGHYGRFGLNINKQWVDHKLTAVAGFEAREVRTASTGAIYRGYNVNNGSFIVPNYFASYPTYPTGTATLGGANGAAQSISATINRFRTYFSNVAYRYLDKYSLSASARFDGNNFFGVEINQKVVPLWSVGAKWDIYKEKFFKNNFFNRLSLRTTYGFQGNVERNLAALTTLLYRGNSSITGLPYAAITNLPNPSLSWEKMAQLSFGLDFALLNDRISGSFELYYKNGTNLIGDAIIDPTAGVTAFRGNFAGMKSNGFDFQLNSQNIKGIVQWNTGLILNYQANKVTRYDAPVPNASYYLGGNGIAPLPIVGESRSGFYSYRWGGLDPVTGGPRIILGDTLNKSYLNPATIGLKKSDLVYNGNYIPPVTGSLLNSINFKGFMLQVNTTFKFGYYFRRNAINYSSSLLVNNAKNWMSAPAEFAQRWIKPGDEKLTNVPSFIYPDPTGGLRDEFYTNSDILVEKGDHIRLQFVNLSYTFENRSFKKLPVQRIQVYIYANNLGILWRANNQKLDPDYPYVDYPPQRTYSLGVKVDF